MRDHLSEPTHVAIEQTVIDAVTLAHNLEEVSRRKDVRNEDWLEALARFGRDLNRLRGSLNQVAPTLGLPEGARERLLRFFQMHEGEIVDKDQLEGVAGISEWARRVRELRVNEGWPISSDTDRSDLRPGEYILERPSFRESS